MDMKTRLFLYHRCNRSVNINILSSISDFLSTVPAQIGQKRKMSYKSVCEVFHNTVIAFPYFSGTLNPLFCLKGFFLGGGHWEGKTSPKLFWSSAPVIKISSSFYLNMTTRGPGLGIAAKPPGLQLNKQPETTICSSRLFCTMVFQSSEYRWFALLGFNTHNYCA